LTKYRISAQNRICPRLPTQCQINSLLVELDHKYFYLIKRNETTRGSFLQLLLIWESTFLDVHGTPLGTVHIRNTSSELVHDRYNYARSFPNKQKVLLIWNGGGYRLDKNKNGRCYSGTYPVLCAYSWFWRKIDFDIKFMIYLIF